MEKQILEILLELQKDMKEVKETVNRIEASQTKDVLGLLKIQKQKTEFEVNYLSNRITEIDKRLFKTESEVERLTRQ